MEASEGFEFSGLSRESVSADLLVLLRVCVGAQRYNKRGTAEQWIKEGKQATH